MNCGSYFLKWLLSHEIQSQLNHATFAPDTHRDSADFSSLKNASLAVDMLLPQE
jgi:hypothetical protein